MAKPKDQQSREQRRQARRQLRRERRRARRAARHTSSGSVTCVNGHCHNTDEHHHHHHYGYNYYDPVWNWHTPSYLPPPMPPTYFEPGLPESVVLEQQHQQQHDDQVVKDYLLKKAIKKEAKKLAKEQHKADGIDLTTLLPYVLVGGGVLFYLNKK